MARRALGRLAACRTHLDGTYTASGFSLTHTSSGETIHYKA